MIVYNERECEFAFAKNAGCILHSAGDDSDAQATASARISDVLRKLLRKIRAFFGRTNTTDLDPGKEDHDGQRRVEDHFVVAEALEVAVLVGVGEQVVEDVVDGHRAVDVERDAADGHDDDHDVQDDDHDGHDDDHDVQDVPERLEI